MPNGGYSPPRGVLVVFLGAVGVAAGLLLSALIAWALRQVGVDATGAAAPIAVFGAILGAIVGWFCEVS